MAILRVPRITTAQRLGLTLLNGEIVFDTDIGRFYGGDGSTIGGIPVGAGMPIGGSTGDVLAKASNADYDTEWLDPEDLKHNQRKNSFTLTLSDISAKKVVLSHAPLFPEGVLFLPDGGITQRYGVDFTVVSNEIRWNGLELDGFLEEGEIINIVYLSE